MTDDQKDGWPLKLHRIGRGLLGRQASRQAPPRLHERPMLVVETPELDLVNILSSTVNTKPAVDVDARPGHKRQNTLEDPRRFNVLDTKNINRNLGIVGTFKKRTSDKQAVPDSSLATREPPMPLGHREQGSMTGLASNNLQDEQSTKSIKPKAKADAQSSSSARAKLDSDAYAAYPSDIKKVIPNPVVNHSACLDGVSTSTASPKPPKSLRRNFSLKSLRRPTTPNSQIRPPVPRKDSFTVQKVFSSSSLKNNGKIVTNLPVTEAEEITSPPPTYGASMDFPTDEKPKVDLSEHPALATKGSDDDDALIPNSDSQLQSHTGALPQSTLPSPASVPVSVSVPSSALAPARSRALSNAQTVRSSIELYATTNNMTPQYTHDTVAPLLIRKATRGRRPSPTPFTSIKRSLSDFKIIPSHPRSLSIPRYRSTKPISQTSANGEYAFQILLHTWSSEPAIPGLSRSLTVSHAKRHSAISSLSQSTSASLSVNPRNSILTTKSAPHDTTFLPTPGSSPASRNSSGPDTSRSPSPVEASEKTSALKNAQVPRRAKKADFIRMLEVPNLMMDCGGYDEQSYATYTYSEAAPYSTGQMIRDVVERKEEGGGGASGLDHRTGEFAQFIAEANEQARGEQRRGVGVDGGLGAEGALRGGKKGVWGSMRRRDRMGPRGVTA
ncbi:hypothetical protein EYC84_000044 [Monilinia fructicola]|uniref:Uncharacterized protein n=1 Tax=Monilinia fructicola TaxID=38448 RepID=A0A5M9JS29_MONFR|nr:hypothetical protein EYC84_000044 [Monilinia fructicola]